MTHVYVVRHGESEGNKIDAFIGRTDVPLTDLGVKQAELTAEYLKDVKFSAIYTSDLMRARQTAAPSEKIHNLKAVPEPAFREIFGGDWEKKPYHDLINLYPETYSVWKNDIASARADNGESVKELYERVTRKLKELALEHDGENILVFTHAMPVRAIMCMAKELPLKNLGEIPWVSNPSVTELLFKDGKFTLVKEGYDVHLGKLSTRLSKDV